jgi:hypothetical protein
MVGAFAEGLHARKQKISADTKFWVHKVRTSSGRCGTLSERSVNYRPLVNLLQRAECTGEHEAANGVAITVCAMRVKFATTIANRNVDVGEVSDTWVYVGGRECSVSIVCTHQ